MAGNPYYRRAGTDRRIAGNKIVRQRDLQAVTAAVVTTAPEVVQSTPATAEASAQAAASSANAAAASAAAADLSATAALQAEANAELAEVNAETAETNAETAETNAVAAKEAAEAARDVILALVKTGTGTPEGAVTANVGTLFLRTDGGTSTTLYVKESGTGNTGWVAK